MYQKSILVTGGAGFIGSHLVDRLIQKGFMVTVFDNMSAGSRANIGHHIGNKGFRLLRGDVRNAGNVQKAVRGADAVFHLAAIVDVQRSVRNPLLANQVNVLGTLNLLEACRNADIDLLVYASSCAVYGDAGRTSIKEDAPLRSISPYATSKLAAETYCLSFQRTYGLPVFSLRLFNVYGPRQRPGPYAGVVAKFTQMLLKNRPPVIYGDGEQTRDFVNVEDAVNAFMLSLKRRKEAWQAINIGSGRAITINDLAKLLTKLTGKTGLRAEHHPAREGEILNSRADIRLARKALGYSPKVPLETGLRRYVDWVRATSGHLK
jgi:UDP-glucose 4-epimerase